MAVNEPSSETCDNEKVAALSVRCSKPSRNADGDDDSHAGTLFKKYRSSSLDGSHDRNDEDGALLKVTPHQQRQKWQCLGILQWELSSNKDGGDDNGDQKKAGRYLEKRRLKYVFSQKVVHP